MINIAILLSTYNGDKYLSKQLDSIFNQDFNDFTLFVRDDFSTDNTLNILYKYQNKHKNIVILDNQKRNIGAKASFYFLLKNVQANYYMFCDQDDIWLENKVRIQFEYIKQLKINEKTPIVIYHDLTLINNEDKVIANSFWEKQKIKTESIKFETLYLKNSITGCSSFFNEQMKKEILKTDYNKILMHDHIISLIAYGFGLPLIINDCLVLYRDHSTSVTSKSEITSLFRIKNFLHNINNKEYVLPQITQLEEYLNVFSSKLINTQIKSISKFISLKNKIPIIRFIYLKSVFRIK